jgi:hypothetical protein
VSKAGFAKAVVAVTASGGSQDLAVMLQPEK